MCPTRNDLKRIVVAFKAYHAIRLGRRVEVKRAVELGDFEPMHLLFIEYARHFADEISLHRAS